MPWIWVLGSSQIHTAARTWAAAPTQSVVLKWIKPHQATPQQQPQPLSVALQGGGRALRAAGNANPVGGAAPGYKGTVPCSRRRSGQPGQVTRLTYSLLLVFSTVVIHTLQTTKFRQRLSFALLPASSMGPHRSHPRGHRHRSR